MVCRNTLNSRKIDCLQNGVGTRCRFFNFIACALWYRADREGWVRNSIFFVFPLFFYLFFTFFCSVWLILSVSIHAYCWATLQFPIEKINAVHTWVLATVPTSLSYYRIRGYSPFNKLQDVHEKKNRHLPSTSNGNFGIFAKMISQDRRGQSQERGKLLSLPPNKTKSKPNFHFVGWFSFLLFHFTRLPMSTRGGKKNVISTIYYISQ